MSTTFFKRLGGHILSFFTQQQNGNLASGAGIATALLVYTGTVLGLPITPDLAAGLVALVTTAIAAGKKD